MKLSFNGLPRFLMLGIIAAFVAGVEKVYAQDSSTSSFKFHLADIEGGTAPVPQHGHVSTSCSGTSIQTVQNDTSTYEDTTTILKSGIGTSGTCVQAANPYVATVEVY